MAIHDVRLPVDIERGVMGGPSFHTTIITTSNGSEYRNADWSKARGRWDVAYGISDLDDLQTVYEFFLARRGKAYGFRFKDWSDYEAANVALGEGDGVETDFQLVKQYEAAGPLPYERIITRPVVGTITVAKDGVPTVAWTLQTGGIIRFTVAPANGVDVTASFEFDVPVRFDVDDFPLTLEHELAASVGGLAILELRE